LSEVICNTSPLQYLHQLGLLRLLPAIARRVTVPTAVVAELEIGRAAGLDLPDPATLDWVDIRSPAKLAGLLPIELGPGEAEVLALARESADAELLLDDLAARHAAEKLGFRVRGTLGVLLDAKRAGFIPTVAPVLDQLQALGFRLHAKTRAEILQRAGETP